MNAQPLEAAVAASARAPRDPDPLVGEMSQVQSLVFLIFRKGDDYVAEERQSILTHLRYEYEMTLEEEARSWGCSPGRAHLREGPELRDLNDRAKQSSAGIANTYNYDLARAILAIGEDSPTANRYTYASRLEAWEQARNVSKESQIDMAETFYAINQAKGDFYYHNRNLGGRAEVAPSRTVCSVCAEYVAGNPYRSMEVLQNKCNLPAHVNCIHYARVLTDRRLTPEECRELWMG